MLIGPYPYPCSCRYPYPCLCPYPHPYPYPHLYPYLIPLHLPHQHHTRVLLRLFEKLAMDDAEKKKKKSPNSNVAEDMLGCLAAQLAVKPLTARITAQLAVKPLTARIAVR